MSSAQARMIIEGAHLSVSELGSGRLVQRLKQIGKARENGLGDTIPPPQIVVCGNQSSGKSSVLERLIGIPFPVGDGGCTKYPIEIVFRYIDASLPQQITASILPCNNRSPELQQIFRKYHRKLSDLSELPHIIEEVSSLINVHGPDTSGADNTVAADVLQIQFMASTVFDITIVDLPGLVPYDSHDEEVEHEDRFLQNLVNSYLARSNTVILAVFEAIDINPRERRSMRLVLKHDPQFGRSVGVFTKADLVSPENRRNVAFRIEELGAKLPNLQFCLLTPPSEHQRNFDLFCQEVLNKTRSHGNHVRLNDLKELVQELLEERVEHELPNAYNEIKVKLGEIEEKLRLLGSERCTVDQIRSSLLGMSMRFYKLAQAAHNCYYEEATTGFFSAEHNKLRTQVHFENMQFSRYMLQFGKRRTETESPYIEMVEILPQQLSVTSEQTLGWIRDNFSRNRGRSFPGNLSHMCLAELFQEQISRWPAIARNHITRVDEMISAWAARAVEEIIHEDHLRLHIMTLCRKDLEETRKLAYDELEKLIADGSRQPITYNSTYEIEVHRFQDSSAMQALRSLVSDTNRSIRDNNEIRIKTDSGDRQYVLDRDDVAEKIGKIKDKLNETIDPVDLLEQDCEDAKVILDSYYEVAMSRFVDNVCRQVVERHFMKRLPSIFSLQTVAELSDDSLLLIGSEPRTRKNRRAQLEATAKGMRESLADLQRHSL